MTKVATTYGKRGRRAFLLEPLGWVKDHLGPTLHHDADVLGALFRLDKPRMHLLALVLAHSNDDASPGVICKLLTASSDELLALVQAHKIAGLGRILLTLPNIVLAAEDYRALLTLLRDGAISRYLHHADVIDAAIIRALHNLPEKLRTRAVLPLMKQVDGMERFTEGLRFLSERSGSTLIAVVNHLTTLGQPEQIAASIRRLVDSLPLPDIAPAVQIGTFRRVDAPREIRSVAKDWHNCLADCVFGVDDGSSAIYISEQLKVICLVTRHGRMGWFLHQVRGPRNAEIAPRKLAAIQEDFSRAGISEPSIVEAITTTIHNRDWKSRSLDRHFDADVFA